jgi:hypothetical protein
MIKGPDAINALGLSLSVRTQDFALDAFGEGRRRKRRDNRRRDGE